MKTPQERRDAKIEQQRQGSITIFGLGDSLKHPLPDHEHELQNGDDDQ